MSEKYWYQDGGRVAFIVIFGGFFIFLGYASYQKAKEDAKPLVTPKITGRLVQPWSGNPSLEITAWHQYAGNLRNGVFIAQVNEDPAKGKEHWDKREHSFEVWEPNDSHAVKFTFPIRNYDPNREIHIGFALLGREIKPYLGSGIWQGQHWKSETTADSEK